MTVITSYYNRTRMPEVSLSYNTETGFYTATVTVIESEPLRSVSASEQIRGIVSLSPVVVSQNTKQSTVDSAIEACAIAIDETEDQSMDPETYTALAYAVGGAVRGAMEALEQ